MPAPDVPSVDSDPLLAAGAKHSAAVSDGYFTAIPVMPTAAVASSVVLDAVGGGSDPSYSWPRVPWAHLGSEQCHPSAETDFRPRFFTRVKPVTSWPRCWPGAPHLQRNRCPSAGAVIILQDFFVTVHTLNIIRQIAPPDLQQDGG